MAIIGQLTLDQVAILEVDSDPSLGGAPAAIGSIATLYNGSTSRMWMKTASGDTAWNIIPRQANATQYATGGLAFADPNGDLIVDVNNIYWDNTNNRLALGANSPLVPQSTIHLDRGTGIGVHVRMTAGATTGQTSGDGTEFGIDDTGAAEIRQYENSNINFYTNNLVRGSFTNDGKFLLGHGTAIDITGAAAVPQFQIIGTAAVQMAGIQYSADTIGPVFNLLKSRNATIATQGLVQSGDEFGRIQFRGSDGTNFQAGASIRALVDGTAATNSMPGYLSLQTTPSGATVPVERVRITSTGLVIHSAGIRLGNETDTTNGTIRFDGTEFLVRQAATWRVVPIVPIVFTSGIGALATTSATYSTITGLTTTPAAGTYLVHYSVEANITADSNGDVSVFVAGNEQVETTRNIGVTSDFGTTSTVTGTCAAMTVLTVNGSQVVDVRFRENGGGTLTVTHKVFMLIPIAR